MTPDIIWAQLPSPIFVVGASHSGKSAFAGSLLDPKKEAAVIGTADPALPAISDRLAALKHQRPKLWETFEQPGGLPDLLTKLTKSHPQVLVDSLNQWVASLLVGDCGKYSLEQMDMRLQDEFARLIEAMGSGASSRIVLVSSEVGAGTTPPAAFERLFRQSMGRLNCRVAERAQAVVLLSSGIPLVMKGLRSR